MSADEFQECIYALSKYFRKMSYEERVKYCRQYANIATWLKLKPRGPR